MSQSPFCYSDLAESRAWDSLYNGIKQCLSNPKVCFISVWFNVKVCIVESSRKNLTGVWKRERKLILTAKLAMSEMSISRFPFWDFWHMHSKTKVWTASGKYKELYTILIQLKYVLFLVNKTIETVEHWDKELCCWMSTLNCHLYRREVQALCNRLQFIIRVPTAPWYKPCATVNSL